MPKSTRHGGLSYEGHENRAADGAEPQWVPVDPAATETPDEPEPVKAPRARTTRKAKADG